MTARATLYEILGVEPTATPDEVLKAYRRLAMQYHPDRNPGDDDAARAYREVTEAYEVLGDPARRAAYDADGTTAPRPNPDQELVDVLAPLLQRVMNGMQSFGPRPEDQDVAAAVKAYLASMIADAERQVADLERVHALFSKVCGRFEVKRGTPDLLNELAAAKTKAVGEQIRIGKAELDRLTRVKKYLDGVTYRRDKKSAARRVMDRLPLYQAGVLPPPKLSDLED